MTTTTILQLILTLLTVSFFNLRVLRAISKIQFYHEVSYTKLLDRLEAVERSINEIQNDSSDIELQ